MSKPRIAFFIDQWRPGSGTENQLQGLLSYLAPDHIDAHLFTLRTPLAPEYRDLFPCPVDCLDIGSLVSPGALFKLPGIVARLRREQFDAAMIYFVDSNLYLVPACRLAGIPARVINRRDMGYWYEKGLLRKLTFINRWATHFLVNAEAVKEQVISHENFAPSRIDVIPNGMWDPENRRRMKDAGVGEAPPGFPADGPVVGITASLREVKRIDRFLEMAALIIKEVPETRFVIAGQGHLQDSLEARAREMGIGEVVIFLGQVIDIPSLLGQLRVGVLTSDSEGLSNSLVEYGLAGVPAVTFDVGGNAEVVREGHTGFLAPPGDVETMARRVIRLLGDDDLQEQMGRAARKHCEEEFSPERVKDMTMDYFASLNDLRSDL
ncbi:MAG: glycosyltransferase [Holophagae bacterium]|nr:glycosyltransferase [Holophagae bacterium]